MKKVLVIRFGAYGDMVICSQVFRLLKEQGWHVTANVASDGFKVMKHNPHIDHFIVNKDIKRTAVELDEYWKELGKGYDRVINLSESIEGTLLKPENISDEFLWPKEKRHKECNVNYYDRSLELAGFSERGLNGELHFTRNEHREAQREMKRYNGKFVVLWSLSGSSFHKAYPYAGIVAQNFLDRYPDAVVITVGDTVGKLLEWDHPQTICKSDKWDIRKSMLMTKYVDLVIGTETAITNASGCYETPKIVLLSHSSHENLTKHWNNCYPVFADVPCYPCHQIHYNLESCPLSDMFIPICIDQLHPEKITPILNDLYHRWKYKEVA